MDYTALAVVFVCAGVVAVIQEVTNGLVKGSEILCSWWQSRGNEKLKQRYFRKA